MWCTSLTKTWNHMPNFCTEFLECLGLVILFLTLLWLHANSSHQSYSLKLNLTYVLESSSIKRDKIFFPNNHYHYKFYNKIVSLGYGLGGKVDNYLINLSDLYSVHSPKWQQNRGRGISGSFCRPGGCPCEFSLIILWVFSPPLQLYFFTSTNVS